MDKGIEKQSITLPKEKRTPGGRPGAKSRWTSGAKTMIGTAWSFDSRMWFTVNNGVLSETYHPDVDQANTRVIRFLVTGPDGFFSDEVWDADHRVEWIESGVPGCKVVSKCKRGRYTIHKEILTDPLRDILLFRVRFEPAEGQDLRLFLSADIHLGDEGADNRGWVGKYKGVPMLLGQRGQVSLAMAFDPPPRKTSVGYVGKSDAYTVLSRQEPLPDTNYAEPGNVALSAEIDFGSARRSGDGGGFLVAMACGGDPAEAAQQARAGTLQEFEKTKALFIQQWQVAQSQYRPIEDLSGNGLDMYRVCTAVLETHQSKRFPGGFVASLSLPWGFARTDKDVGGYHVVWPRDLSETAMGKLASGDARSARSSLFYLSCTQDEDGGWSQNMWLDGTPHWGAIQMDAIALPVLLADKLKRDDALDGYDPRRLMHEAARFLLQHGPVTQQDRWEALPGYSPYTMAVQVAALLAAADCADDRGAPEEARFLRETADAWNDAIDEFTYVRGTELAKKYGVEGYYVRITPPKRVEARETGNLKVVMPNRPFGQKHQLAAEIVSPDALTMVRFGVRATDDPRMLATVKVIDGELKRETATGPGWTRSSKDGYGEKKDGQPFKKHGIGRCWPLLAGERAHYELACGNHAGALELLKTMSRQTSECGMLPEQVWDAEDIPSHELFNGRPTGSGMPLVWAHAEYIKLLRSLHENAVWDAIPQTTERYLHSKHPAHFQIWTPKQRRGYLTAGKNLRVDLQEPARVSWRIQRGPVQTVFAEDSHLGLHTAMLPFADLAPGTAVRVEVQPLEAKDGNKSENRTDAFLLRVREGDGTSA